MSWLGRLLRRVRMERDLEREFAFHLDEQTDALVRGGVPREEARRQAHIMFGGIEHMKEDTRDARGTRWLEDLARDTRLALRSMARSPGFTAAAVLTLALGIGATTAVWSIMDALMLRTLPVKAPGQIHTVSPVSNDDGNKLHSYIRYQRLRHVLPDTNALTAMSSQVTAYAILGDRPVAVSAQLVTGNWFSLLGVGAERGRPLGPQDDVTAGGHPVAVVSSTFWHNRLASDPSVVGKTLRVNGYDLTIVGVAQAGFTGLTVGSPVEVWIPAVMQDEVKFHGNSFTSDASSARPWIPQYGVHWLTLVSRVDPADATAMQTRLNAQYKLEVQEEYRNSSITSRDERLRETLVLEPLSRGFSGLRDSFSDPLKMLFLSVATILLIACGNLAGLLLARSASRTHEIAVRVSLGAKPGRLIRQVMTESLTLALIGGALSILVAYWGSRALLRIASSGESAIPLDVPIDARMLLFCLTTTLLAGLLFGLAPALRVGKTKLYDSFKTGGRVVNAGGSHRLPLGRSLLIGQIGLSLVLVTSAGLFVRTFQNFLSINSGFQADHVVAARIDVLSAGYTTEQLPGLYERLTSAARALPGVKSVALSWLTLGTGGRSVGEFTVPGVTLPPGKGAGQMNYVTPGFFSTVGMPLLRGREFATSDDSASPQVAIVSERTARDFFGTVDVVGRRFGFGTPPEFEIVGVVGDARVNSIKDQPARLVFLPLSQGLRHITNVTVRVSGSPNAVIPALRNAVHNVDPNIPLRDAIAISTLHERGLSRERMLARIAGSLGLLALLLVGIGLYGVVAYSVSRRTNEMGVRLALGATPSTVSSLVLRESIQTVGVGLLVGMLLAFPALRLTQGLVFGIQPNDPRAIGISAALLMVVGLVATIIPALRASRINPIEAIRAE